MDLVARKRFDLPLDREAVAADWAARGYSCSLFVDPPGQEWLGFVHSVDELVTVVAGRLRVKVDDLDAILEPGDEVYIPKGARHDVCNAFEGESRWLYGYAR